MAFFTKFWLPESRFDAPHSVTPFTTKLEASAHADQLLASAPIGSSVAVTDGTYTLEYRVAEAYQRPSDYASTQFDDTAYAIFAPDDFPM